MYLDLHPRGHTTFAAYEMEYPDERPWWWDDFTQQRDRAREDAIAGWDESDAYLRQTRQEDVDYRNRALSQSGSNARLAASTSRQNASLAASTSRANAQLAARTQLKNTQMQIDHQYKVFRERLNELEIPTMNLDIWYRGQQIALAKANLALQARGPRNALQYSTAMGLADSGGDMPASIAAIARNQSAPAFSGQSGTPEPLTYESLAAKYGLGGGAPGGADAGQMQSDKQREDAVLSAIKMVADRGPQGTAAGTFESLTDYDRDILASGLEKLGYDADDFFQRYQRAGIGQGDVRAA